MKNKKHIAMRCNQEQFKVIKPKLEKSGVEIFDITKFKKDCYLCLFKDGTVTNGTISDRIYYDEIHEQWNEKISLEACGIETIPTLEEVKEYFKDADKCKDNCDGEEEFIVNLDEIRLSAFGNYVQGERIFYLWDKEKGYAKILTYKTPKFEITKETVIKYQMKEEFPEVFKVKLPDDFTGWAKTNNIGNEKWISKFENGLQKYGIDAKGYWLVYESKNYIENNMYEATPEEVTEALKKEAVRLGFVEGGFFVKLGEHTNYLTEGGRVTMLGEMVIWSSGNQRDGHGVILFKKGKWATVIQTKTIQQAEELLKELGHEIKIVS